MMKKGQKFKRRLETIYTKLNLLRLIKADNTSLSKELDIKITFPTLHRKYN